MTIRILGMELSIGSCSSLKEMDQFMITGENCQGKPILAPSQVALKALEDGALDDYNSLVFINSPHPDLLDLPHRLNLESHQYQMLLLDNNSDLDPLIQANNLIREDPDRKVLLSRNSASGTISLLLTHPNRNHPAYADITPVQDPLGLISDTPNQDLGFITYLHLSQNIKTLTQESIDDIHGLTSHNAPASIALGWMDPGLPSDNDLIHIVCIATAIHKRHIPGSPGGLSPDLIFPPETPYYLADGSRPWLDTEEGFKRNAFVYAWENEPALGWLLSEPNQTRFSPVVRTSISGIEPYLVLIPGNTISEVLGNLQELKTFLAGDLPLGTITNNAYKKYLDGKFPLVCCLVASNAEELNKEIDFAKKGIQEVEKTNGIWSSPKGSYFTTNPLGENGLAFVYPGAFNSYPGMGQFLFDHFPTLYESVGEITPNISHSLSEEHIFPRIIPNHTGPSPQERMEDFFNHPNELIESGISFSLLHTLILKDIFQIKPQAAFGYSLGEASMLWANKVWGNVVQSSLDWSESPLFKDQLFGEMTTLREYWNDQKLGKKFWGSYILKATPGIIQSAIEKENQAFLTIINTSEEVVIAGLDEACQRVINEVKCHALPMPFNASIHNPGVEARYHDFASLYTNKVINQPKIRFYSASDYNPLELSSDSLAHSMAKMTCSPVDFPRLVNKAYQDGIRIFVEVGPQKTCSRWIEKILESNPHSVIPINKKHQPDYAGIVKVLSMLTSHQVPLDLSPLYSLLEADPLIVKQNGTFQLSQESIPAQPSGIHPNSAENLQQVGYIPEVSDQDLIYLEHISRIFSDITTSQEQFLNHQAAITDNIKRILSLQGTYPPDDQLLITSQPPLFNEEQIEAFTVGDHRICFGELFEEFEDRRIPRLPNGPLRFIDQVVEIDAEEGEVIVGSSLISQFGIPTQDWFLASPDGPLPYITLMEAALQPCGFLSAYMGSIRGRSNADLYFRNLDGEITLLFWPDLAGSTITNRVKLISSSTLQDVIIQEYSFELSHNGKPFLMGKSSFGYFISTMLKNQSGLNGNHSLEPWKTSHPDSGSWVELNSDQSPGVGYHKPHIPHIPRTWISKNGGELESGYIQAQIEIPDDAWFYQAHFYQDPVMPGSLGVEYMAQALIGSSTSLGVNPGVKWRVKPGSKTCWKYRGQITPGVESVDIELFIKERIRENDKDQITADGNLWLGNTRIYEVKDISLETY